MGIHQQLPTPTPRLAMPTPLQPMGMGILLTDRGTITMVILAEEAMVTVVMGIGGKREIRTPPRAQKVKTWDMMLLFQLPGFVHDFSFPSG